MVEVDFSDPLGCADLPYNLVHLERLQGTFPVDIDSFSIEISSEVMRRTTD